MFETRTTASQAARRLELLGDSLAGQLGGAGLGDGARAGGVDGGGDDGGSGAGPASTQLPGAGPGGALPPPLSPSRPAGGPGRHAARGLPRSERIGAGVADRVPGPVRAVWATRLGGAHVAVLALLLAVALSVAAWWALSARPQQAMPGMAPATDAPASAVMPPPEGPAPAPDGSVPTPEGPATPDGTGAAPAPSGTTPWEPAPGTQQVAGEEVVVVDVAGRVHRPGIVTLPAGSRVADALDAAGGPRGGVELTSLNLARVLLDGEQLLVGVQAAVPPPPTGAPPGTPGDPPTPGTGAPLVNLNTATEAELDTLPGVGPVTAQAILGWRAEHGGFTSVDELLEVTGIGEVTLEELRPLVTV